MVERVRSVQVVVDYLFTASGRGLAKLGFFFQNCKINER